jgi:hemolysin activation/secretion protein
MTMTLASLASVAFLVFGIASASNAQNASFDIGQFQVTGNASVSSEEIQGVLAPYVGAGKQYDDVEHARAAVERFYRQKGFEFVRVVVPEQEVSKGVVAIRVIEGTVRTVVVTGNQYFDEANVLAALPALKTGAMPDLKRLSASTQLSNENPAKQVKVTLGTLGQTADIEAIVDVADTNPQRVFFTLDNTGTSSTGRYRTGIAYQHANLFNRDHLASVAYTTSPDSPSGVRVRLYSLGYRLPLYRIGDSLELVYGNSSVNTPSASPTLGGVLGITGRGDVLGVRWNHYLARAGDQTAKLVFGVDDKYIDSRCTTSDGNELSYAPPTPPLSVCVPYRTRPISIAYAGQIQRAGMVVDYSAAFAYNLATGTRYTNLDGRTDRYSYLTPGNRSTRDNFRVIRLSGGYLGVLPEDWQLRVGGNGQFSADPLVTAEQFNLSGASAVRGMDERAVTSDSGLLVNAELYTPDMAPRAGVPGILRLLAFADAAKGYNRNTAGSVINRSTTVSSIGAGLRYSYNRNVVLRLDLARIVRAGTSATENNGDWRTQLSLVIGS